MEHIMSLSLVDTVLVALVTGLCLGALWRYILFSVSKRFKIIQQKDLKPGQRVHTYFYHRFNKDHNVGISAVDGQSRIVFYHYRTITLFQEYVVGDNGTPIEVKGSSGIVKVSD